MDTVQYESVSCIICESNDLDLIYQGKGMFKEVVHVCICKKCGFSFLNPRWTENTYMNYYTYDYDKHYRSKPILLSPERDSGSYHSLYLRLEKRFKTFSPKRILDIGSGDGSKIAYLKEKYPEAALYAIEPSEAYKTQIENRGIHFISNDVNANWDASYNGFFDLIILRHTIEHFLTPKTVIEKINHVLSEDGLVYIAAPDAYNIELPLIKSFFRVVHPYYYNRDSISNLLHKFSFKILSIESGDNYHPQELFVFARKTKEKQQLNISEENYLKQKRIFTKQLKKETSVLYIFIHILDLVVTVKKFFFPKPILKKKVLV